MPAPQFTDYGFGYRLDGTPKGPGWDSFPGFQGQRASTSSEVSFGMPDGPGYDPRADPLAPLVYQGITPWDRTALEEAMSYPWRLYDMPGMDDVQANARAAADVRRAAGLSPFWTEADPVQPFQFTYTRRPSR